MKIGPNTEVCVHTLANQMIAAGYTGQNLRDPQKALAYITLAACNADVEYMLPPAGFDFWRTAYTKFALWQIMQGAAPAPAAAVPSAEVIQLPQPPEKHARYVRLAEGGEAVYIGLSREMAGRVKEWEHGIYAEIILDDNNKHIRFRPAEEGEPAVKLQHGPGGAYLRILAPAGTTIVDTSRDSDADDTHGGPDAAA